MRRTRARAESRKLGRSGEWMLRWAHDDPEMVSSRSSLDVSYGRDPGVRRRTVRRNRTGDTERRTDVRIVVPEGDDRGRRDGKQDDRFAHQHRAALAVAA